MGKNLGGASIKYHEAEARLTRRDLNEQIQERGQELVDMIGWDAYCNFLDEYPDDVDGYTLLRAIENKIKETK